MLPILQNLGVRVFKLEIKRDLADYFILQIRKEYFGLQSQKKKKREAGHWAHVLKLYF